MKKIFLITAVAVAISIAAGATSFAAGLPTYEVKGLPISPVQVGVLGAANVQQSQLATSAVSPHQLRVLAPRPKLNTVTTEPVTIGAGH